jgi:hypothetical protein
MTTTVSQEPSVLPGGHGFRIAIADESLEFTEFVLQDPIPTGRQIAEAFAAGDPTEFIILQWLDNGMLEELRLDEQTDIHARGVERFVVVKSDRSFRFEVEGRRQEWAASTITGATIKRLAGVNPDDVDVFQNRCGQPDLHIDDHDVVDLASAGVERFSLRPRERLVEILVNNKPVKIERGRRTGLEIKQAAISQGVNIQLDFVLSLETAGGHTKIIGDTDHVVVRKGQHFTAIDNDDNS